MRKLLTRLAVGVLLAVPLAAPAAPATAAPAALSCTITFGPPTQIYTYAYSTVQVACNQVVSFIGGYVSLYRDGTFVGTNSVYNNRTSAAYTSVMVACVPGNYHAMSYGFANYDGGAPDYAERVTTATVPISCA